MLNKLFVFADEDGPYRAELQCAFARHVKSANVRQLDVAQLSADYLTENSIQVVISSGLPKEWFYIFRGLAIVSIVFDDIARYHDLADIVVDHRSDDTNKYFTGPALSLLNNTAFDINEITDLISLMEWDSEFFGFPVAFLSCRYLSPSILAQVDRFIRQNKVRLVEYLCNCHDDRSVLLAEQQAFHFTDIRLTFDMRLPAQVGSEASPYSFGAATPAHIEHLRHLTESMYKDSRYFYDGHFDVAVINAFYANWIEKAVLGSFDDECLCLFDRDTPIGFCSIKYGDPDSAKIGLFGIDAAFAGRGLGKTLLANVFNRLRDKHVGNLSVVTQGRNYAAQRLYQSMGFRTQSTQLWYHKWI